MIRRTMTSARKKKGIGGYLLASVILFLSLIISVGAMQIAFNSGNQDRVPLFALLSAVCVIGSSLFLLLWALRHNARERLENLEDEPRAVTNLNETYRATHDVSDVIIFLILAVVSALLAFRFAADGRHFWGVAMLSVMSLFFSRVSI
jgi:hypothetical protein